MTMWEVLTVLSIGIVIGGAFGIGSLWMVWKMAVKLGMLEEITRPEERPEERPMARPIVRIRPEQ